MAAMSEDFPNLDELKAGDITAWDVAFRHLWPMALRAALHPKACLVTWEAEDIASEAILEFIAQVEQVATVDEAKAMVITIAFRRAISLARRKSAVKRRLPEADHTRFPAEEATDSSSEFAAMEQKEMLLLLRRALDVLDAQTRSILLDKIEKDLTYEELSERHGIPLGTVCTRIARALQKMRLQLQDSPVLLKELREYLR